MMVTELLAGTMRRVRGGIAAGEDDMRQTYTVKHIRKGLTLLSHESDSFAMWAVHHGVTVSMTTVSMSSDSFIF